MLVHCEQHTGLEKVTAPADEMLPVSSAMYPSSATFLPSTVTTCHFLIAKDGSSEVSMLQAPMRGKVTLSMNAASAPTPASDWGRYICDMVVIYVICLKLYLYRPTSPGTDVPSATCESCNICSAIKVLVVRSGREGLCFATHEPNAAKHWFCGLVLQGTCQINPCTKNTYRNGFGY